MLLIVGLGNPGKQYENTRHNVGFLFLRNFWENIGKPLYGFSSWENKTRFNSLVSQGKIHNKKIILALPQTFMNNSGEAIQKISSFYKIPSSHIIIIHDEIDLPLGKFKTQINRGPAGHNGVKSIIEKLGTKNFWRLRIGIRPPKKTIPTEKFVLQKISSREEKVLSELFPEINITLLEKIKKPA